MIKKCPLFIFDIIEAKKHTALAVTMRGLIDFCIFKYHLRKKRESQKKRDFLLSAETV